MTEFASSTITDGIAVITLDDGKVNALSFDMMATLNAALAEAEANADVIILTSGRAAMCAGFDLKVMRNEPDKVADMVGHGGRLMLRIFSSKTPIIIASPGHGIAGGCLLMLTGDYRIGVEGESRYGLNESAIGMVLPPYGIDWARFKINNQHLDRCFVGAELVDSATAQKFGILDEVVTQDTLMVRAMEKAQEFQQLDGKAFAGNKRLVRGALTAKMKADLDAGTGLAVGS
ncbi:MAG: crotonase/enoyl-CoA hydratase family protein [Alphaproteobacteria bacterium]|nr:crotonase/enoyl-CoA hydratase family protein [Alphaproteobacteria bacterium]